MGTVDPKRSGTVARIMPGGSTTSGMADPMDGGTSSSSTSTSTSTSFSWWRGCTILGCCNRRELIWCCDIHPAWISLHTRMSSSTYSPKGMLVMCSIGNMLPIFTGNHWCRESRSRLTPARRLEVKCVHSGFKTWSIRQIKVRIVVVVWWAGPP